MREVAVCQVARMLSWRQFSAFSLCQLLWCSDCGQGVTLADPLTMSEALPSASFHFFLCNMKDSKHEHGGLDSIPLHLERLEILELQRSQGSGSAATGMNGFTSWQDLAAPL